MHRDDLISQVRVRARLHGRSEARRVLRAVLLAFRTEIPDETFRRIAAQLPAELHLGDDPAPAAGLPLVRAVAARLYVNEPNAAFLTRVVFEQLNAYCHGVTPASVAASLPAGLRPLVSARADDPAQRFRRLFPAIGPSATVLNLSRVTPAEPAAAEPAAAEPAAAEPAITAVIARPAGPAGTTAGTTRA
jgi:uncharacterized protein (DUF2267 family)